MRIPGKRKVRTELPGHLYGFQVGPLLAFPQVIAEHGGNPAKVLAQAGLAANTFADANHRVSVDAFGRLCRFSELATGCAHIALLAGGRFQLASAGDLGLLMKHSPTLGQACRNMALHLHLQDRVAVPLLFSPSPGRVALGYSVLNYDTPASDKMQDATLAILYCLLRQLCGPGWRPLLVQFAHGKPRDVLPFQLLFDCRLQFDARFSAIVFAARWLDHPMADADPAVYDLLSERLVQRGLEIDSGLSDKVRRVLQSMVLSGTASADAVATLFELSERTLRRRLEGEGTSFQGLLNETLLALAKQLMTETTLTISEITAALHYRDISTFSKAFRRWTGRNPTQWRSSIAADAG